MSRFLSLSALLVLGLFLALAIAALFLGLRSTPAHAATINVTTSNDELNSDGDCSLREAIRAANTDSAVDTCTAGSGADVIVLPSGTYTLSIAGTGEDAAATGDLDITDDLTINGTGAATTIIDGGGIDRVFFVLSAKVDISDVTVQGGAIPGTSGGGILNFGTLTLTNTTVSGNSAAAGAGITSDFFDVLTLTDSTVSGNTASQTGGGIHNNGSAVTLTRSTVSGNTAGSNGGGIFNLQNFATLELTDSTVSGNTATNFDGGGIYITGFHTETVTNSTVSGNTAGRGGGGIYLQQGTLDLTNSTISGNTAASFAGGIFDNLSVGGVTLTNTIVANQLSGEDCVGTITSSGHNLDSDSTCGLGGTGDLSGGNADLDPLALNAPGTTETHALGTSSDAIDAGDDGAAPATDQRGSPRVGTSDIGAYEFQGTATPTPAPDATATAIPTATPAPTGTPAPTPTATAPAATPTSVLGVTQLPTTGDQPTGGSGLTWFALAIGMLIAATGGLTLAYQRRRVL